MSFQEIEQLIIEILGNEVIVESKTDVLQPYMAVSKDNLLRVCSLLKEDKRCYFDYLNCLSGVDNGVEANTFTVVYHLISIIYSHRIVLKCTIERADEAEIPSISSIWRAADWHEREIFDLFGIKFKGHPNLKRILLPDDWEGHPLRKDYLEAEQYQGIKIKSE